MPYTRLLNNIVAESNLSYKEIAEKCTQLGTKIDPSYISKLLAGKCKVPSEKVSRAIAKACNYDETYLVIEGYVDTAPKEIKDILYNLKTMTTLSSINFFSNTTNKEDIELLIDTLNNEPISDFLANFLHNQENSIFKFEKNNLKIYSKLNNITFQLKEPLSLLITNDDMYPIIPKNSKVIISIKDKYKNGDIIAFKDKNNNIKARYYLTDNKTINLVAINRKLKPITLDTENINILGKIEKVIIEI